MIQSRSYLKLQEEPYRESIENTFGLLETLQKYSRERKNMKIYLYMTPFEKYLPEEGEDMSEMHINSGYHMVGSEWVYVYRKEEWLKVFCHEMIHAYELDGSTGKEDTREECESLVKYKETCEKGDLRSYEGITEGSAILLMILLGSKKRDILQSMKREKKHEEKLKRKTRKNKSVLIERYVRLKSHHPKNKFILEKFLNNRGPYRGTYGSPMNESPKGDS